MSRLVMSTVRDSRRERDLTASLQEYSVRFNGIEKPETSELRYCFAEMSPDTMEAAQRLFLVLGCQSYIASKSLLLDLSTAALNAAGSRPTLSATTEAQDVCSLGDGWRVWDELMSSLQPTRSICRTQVTP